MRRTYVAALIEVPQNDASLLVAAICTTDAPGRPEQQGGQLDQPAAADHRVDEARGQGREDEEEDDLRRGHPCRCPTSAGRVSAELLDDDCVVVLRHRRAEARADELLGLVVDHRRGRAAERRDRAPSVENTISKSAARSSSEVFVIVPFTSGVVTSSSAGRAA